MNDDARNIIRDLEGLRSIEANWDHMGAEKPIAECIDRAIAITKEFGGFDGFLTTVTATPEGHVGLCWSYGISVDAEVCRDGLIKVAAVLADDSMEATGKLALRLAMNELKACLQRDEEKG